MILAHGSMLAHQLVRSAVSASRQRVPPAVWKHGKGALNGRRAYATAADAASPPPSVTEQYFAKGLKRTGKLEQVRKVLVVGSGGLSIGQAGEFDYSGKRSRHHFVN